MLVGTAVNETEEVSKNELTQTAVDMLNHAMTILSVQEMLQPSTKEESMEQFIKMEASRLFANALLDTNITLTEHGYTAAADTDNGAI